MDTKARLLLVESNVTSRLFFTDVFWLHNLGSEFDLLVADGVEAAERFLSDTKKRPDFVFLDLVMKQKEHDDLFKTSPEVGLDFISRIKNDPELKGVKVIVYSSYPEEKYGALAKERGVDMYIYKSDNLPQDILKLLKDLHAEHVAAQKGSAKDS